MIRCDGCKFYIQNKYGDPAYGNCHRFPPQNLMGGGWGTPSTYHKYWCGEFCPKDQNDLELMMHLQDKHPDIYERVRRQIMGGKNEA